MKLYGVAVHIGRKVKAVFEASRPKLTVTALASEIGRSRKNVYELFASPTIDTGLLRQIGKALKHDFFQYLASDTSRVAEPQAAYGKQRASDRSPLQLTVNIDPADPLAQDKLERIMRILKGE